MSISLRVLSGRDVATCLSMKEAIAAMADAFTLLTTRRADAPLRTRLGMDGAASGLATDLMARDDAEVVAQIGAGAQAFRQIEAVCAVRRMRRALIFDLDPGRAHDLAARARNELGVEATVLEETAGITEATVVCTATPSATPVFDDAALAPGTHINGVGSYRPDLCEIPPETITRARLVVDSRTSALAEAGDIVQPMEAGIITKEHLFAELGELVTGNKPGRADSGEITVFKSVGHAVQDLAAASRALHNAEKLGLGTVVDL